MSEHIHFVTGRLAEHALRRLLPSLAADVGFSYSVDVLPITVAALMRPDWIAKHIRVPEGTSRVLLPGYCTGDLAMLQQTVAQPVEIGPRELNQLPAYFSRLPRHHDYGQFDIEILAEINHCPQLTLAEILSQAQALAAAGADWIDIGCQPGRTWTEVGEVVRAVRDRGLRVSIDSYNTREIEIAVQAGAELVLSVNSSNREAALDWGVEVVAVPDDPALLSSLEETVEHLAQARVPLRIDPILEPIAFGFARSLERYLEIRRRYPDSEMMMGLGNLTELTDVDSAGINTLLMGLCQELGIRSVLTTQVINWARSSVQECDRARRLMHYAVEHKVLPKHLETGLLMLRDAQVTAPPRAELTELASSLRDNNYRIFAAEGEVHLVGKQLHVHAADPFEVMEQLHDLSPHLDASHAFYLGYEMCKAHTALVLGKDYQQDEPLDWGLATRAETRHYLKRRRPPQSPGGRDA